MGRQERQEVALNANQVCCKGRVMDADGGPHRWLSFGFLAMTGIDTLRARLAELAK